MTDRFGAGSAVVEAAARRAFQPVWTGPDGRPAATAEALLDALDEAPSHGLPAEQYGPDRLGLLAGKLDTGASPAEQAEFEAAMTAALIDWGTDIASGVLTPSDLGRDMQIRVERPEPGALLAGLASAADPAAWLAGLAPQSEEYARLRTEYGRMAKLVRQGGWGAPVAKGATLRLGNSGKRVEALRLRLQAMGDLPGGAQSGADAVIAVNEVTNDAGRSVALSDPWIYDETVAEAVKRFQARHGLNTDGVVGPATLGALNVSAEERLRQIAVNLERLRWLNRDLGDKRVMVNIAGFTMRVIENGETVFTSRVVVGKPEHQTPEFSDEMEHMVVNPSWNVPWSIATKEILPALRRDRTYLARNNMELIGADPFWIDWHAVTPSTFPGRIKQRPGPGNALGRVKFMFPNDNAIYLHDTPARSLFAKDMRAYSHGCVRLEKPYDFARFLLSAQSSDPAGLFDRLLRSGNERWVQLDEHIPVHLGYRTAWLDADGTQQFRSDIYGRDGLVMAALEAKGVSLPIH